MVPRKQLLIKGFVMKKLKLSLIAASAICAAAATALTMTTVAAADDYRDVTLTGTNVFYAGVGGAEISVARVSDDSEDGHTDYTSFEMGDGETVSFRKNLAYSWFAAGEDGFGAHNTFSMTIGFEDIAFESYVIRFQSQQYNITEDGVPKITSFSSPKATASTFTFPKPRILRRTSRLPRLSTTILR